MDEPGTASGGSLFDYYLFIAQPVQVAHRFITHQDKLAIPNIAEATFCPTQKLGYRKK